MYIYYHKMQSLSLKTTVWPMIHVFSLPLILTGHLLYLAIRVGLQKKEKRARTEALPQIYLMNTFTTCPGKGVGKTIAVTFRECTMCRSFHLQ